MFVLAENNEIKASCVITEEGKGIYEIKTLLSIHSSSVRDMKKS